MRLFLIMCILIGTSCKNTLNMYMLKQSSFEHILNEEINWNYFFYSIVAVESQFNAYAVNGECVGYIQSDERYVAQVNKIQSDHVFTLSDRHNLDRCRLMFDYMQNKYNPTKCFEIGSKQHSRGVWAHKKDPKKGQWYYNRVMKKFNEFKNEQRDSDRVD